MNCYYCPETEHLLPVGPDRAPICESCTSSTSERKAASLLFMEEIMEAGRMMAGLAALMGLIVPRARGLTNPKADQVECIQKFSADNGLDPENTDHQDRAMNFDMGFTMLAQGSHKPDEQEDTADVCAGWQAAHDRLILRVREQADMDGISIQGLFQFLREDKGIKLQEGATK